MTEIEVLEKLFQYKEAILKLKLDRDSWKTAYEDLKHKTYLTIKYLVENSIEPKEREIQELKSSSNLSSELQAFFAEMDELLGI